MWEPCCLAYVSLMHLLLTFEKAAVIPEMRSICSKHALGDLHMPEPTGNQREAYRHAYSVVSRVSTFTAVGLLHLGALFKTTACTACTRITPQVTDCGN